MSNRIKRFLRSISRGAAPPPKRFVYPWKVLCILRDEPDMANIVELWLARTGLEIMTVFDAQEGLELMRVEQPDVVLLDEPTFGKDKFQVYNAVKADKALCQIPLIFIAGKPFSGDWEPPGKDALLWPSGYHELIEAIEWATGSGRPAS